MSLVFADIFSWIAITNPLDASHARARSFMDDIVTTEEVLTEYLNYFAEGNLYLRRKTALIAQTLLQGVAVFVQPQSSHTFRAGLDLYNGRPDKGYSLTDCISMVTMRREGLTAVLTNDRHFEQEGFRRLFDCRKSIKPLTD